ncbi:MAG: type III-A CRISPR-associated RAMP protein Csm5 [Bacteroidales bacterium]|nr:type III-A CRISPR-associated RAMP protein Csm5 [Bacteroidales bacterium]MCF8398516.1 type III-A CRISPR-associated RAMP protein Csm5 [Bacteroidales bacterium]
MANVKALLLSPVHIGSGIELQQNIEFLIHDQRLAVVDDKKVLEVIGEDNISQWISYINKRENLMELLKQRKPDVTISDVADREMDVYGTRLMNKKTLKEQLHNGQGFPMIPGSSIKGAIRTAIITHLVNKHTKTVKNIISEYKNLNASKNPGWRWQLRDFQKVEERILNMLLSGSNRTDPNRNAMRFLQVTDASFNFNTIASNVLLLNLTWRGWDFKGGSDQLVEFIGQDSESRFRISINHDLLGKNHLKTDTAFLESLEKLFEIINEHNKMLINEEINMWKDEAGFPGQLEIYLDILNEIKQTALSLNKNEAILRLGGHTGWNSISGAWAKNNKELFDDYEWEILKKSLNKGRNVDYFPKTRKIEEEGDVFGYIKLSLEN